MKKFVDNKGMTMVALVITIIVLVILATISIQAITKTGLFNSAKKARDDAKASEAKESITLVLNAFQIEHSVNDTSLGDYLKTELAKSQASEDKTIDNYEQDGENYKIYKDGYYLTVDSNGKIIADIQKAEEGATMATTQKVAPAQGKFVQYDAGDWTETQIKELQNSNLYMLNSSKESNNIYNKSDTATGLNLTFGGFTYKGDTANADAISKGTIVTSRNQSVAPESGDWGTPTATGWKILDCEEKDGKIYVTKIIHAGSPENFVYETQTENDGLGAEYILSSGTTTSGISTINGITLSKRLWDYYKDQNQLDLISDVHEMTFDEAQKITGATSATDTVRKTGGYYYLATNANSTSLETVDSNGSISYNQGGCWGIRPVVTMVSGVYIKSGDGTTTSPYVLGKD